jgi:hypothetical protein
MTDSSTTRPGTGARPPAQTFDTFLDPRADDFEDEFLSALVAAVSDGETRHEAPLYHSLDVESVERLLRGPTGQVRENVRIRFQMGTQTVGIQTTGNGFVRIVATTTLG